jgi:hypothetical protein
MRTRLALILTAVVVVLVAADRPSAQMRGMGSMNGTVVDEDGKPLPDADVRTALASGGRLECKSDEKGTWNLRGVGRGEWEVMIVKPGYTPRAIRVVLNQELARTELIKVVLKKS